MPQSHHLIQAPFGLPLKTLSDFAERGYVIGEMQSKSDIELLREYAEHGSEHAFAEIVTRHTNLVYSAATRQVQSPDMAADVTQSVFVGLARGARALSQRLNENASLAGWLCRSARNISLNLRRNEFRQHSRERQAMEQLKSIPENAPNWEHLRPVLDEAMSELSESDYDAVVMRFFNNHDLRSVGRALGVSDDAAQKRVARALDKLRERLSRRGISSSASALSIVLSANAIQAAPTGLAASISSAVVLAGTTITSTMAATKAIAMTTLQKGLLSTVVLASAVAPLAVQHQAQAKLRQQEETARRQTEQLEKVQAENGRLADILAKARNSAGLSEDQNSELLRLRGEIGGLRQDARRLGQGKPAAQLSREDVLAAMSKAFSERAGQLKLWLETHPSEIIPELQFLSETDWPSLGSSYGLDTEEGCRHAASRSREAAMARFANEILQPALKEWAKHNSGQFPADLSQINPYFKGAIDEAILSRWEILPVDDVASYLRKQLGAGEHWVIAPKAPVDPTLDLPTICGLDKVVRAAAKPVNQWVRAR